MNNERHERRRITRAIKVALELIAEHDAELAGFLSETINTGEYLSYSPGSEPTRSRKSQTAKKIPHRQRRNPNRSD
jgi:hypothetical protein